VPSIEGSLHSDAVMQSLSDYHPMAHAWGLFHKALLSSPTCHISEEVLLELHGPSFPLGPVGVEISNLSEVIVHPMGPSRLREDVEHRIDSVIDRNSKLFFMENPGFQLEGQSAPQKVNAPSTVINVDAPEEAGGYY